MSEKELSAAALIGFISAAAVLLGEVAESREADKITLSLLNDARKKMEAAAKRIAEQNGFPTK